MCCMLSTFHVSSRIVANISGPSFSFLNSSGGLTGGKHYQKTAIAIFRFVFHNFTIPGYFPYILFYSCLFSLLSSWFFIVVCGSISVQGSFFFLTSSWGLTGGKHYQKTAISIFRFVFQNFTIPGYFPYILFYSCLFSLLSSCFFIAVCGFISVQGTSYGLVSL